MNDKILYIGNSLNVTKTGSDVVNYRNIRMLTSIFGKENIHFIHIKDNSFIDKLQFYIGGIDRDIVQEALEFLNKNKDYKYVFLSQSLMGRIAKVIKKKLKDNIKIITFFHNVEKCYAKEYIKTIGFRGYPFYLAAIYNEKLAVKYSDECLLLNERDQKQLYQEYGRKTDFLLPVSCSDNFIESKILKNKLVTPIYLFVGVNFFANVSGVDWFIKNVLPKVSGRLIIVGKGMDVYKSKWSSDRVEVFGFVPDISDFYYNSSLVIAPIFVGGGMKTKTAEALMYGKTIVGTKESFEGYCLNEKAVKVCENEEDFINVLNEQDYYPFNEVSRKIYKDNYTDDVILEKFSKVFENQNKQ